MRAAVLAPGYGGTPAQPIIRSLARALDDVGIVTGAVTFSTRGRRPSAAYAAELGDLRAARDALRERGAERIALVGRSFGGRMCAFLAVLEPPDALAIVGHPISPPGRPRPKDEEALARLACPTLIVQGSRDELGPLPVLERIAAADPRIDLVVIEGARHDLRASEREAVSAVARWLDAILR
ncbi:MAG TPA: alpha/beta family hydrolase [Candidatus Limnocylindria bacterium]|nr:alpha/beta family hydrolase [Candidatus Limnocylindria bacterium]